MNFKRSSTSMAIAIMALSIISMASIQQDAFAQTLGMSIIATADQDSKSVTVTGMTALDYYDIIFVVISPNGNIVGIDQVTPSDDGNFTTTFKVGPTWNEDGLYSITAKQGQSSIYTLTVLVQITSGMTVETSVTDSTFETGTLDSLMIPKVTRDAGIEISADAVEGSTTITITGSTDRMSEDVTLTVTSPNGNIVSIAQVSPDSNGEFTSVFTTGGPLWKQDGDYTITARQNDNPKYTASVEVEVIDGIVIPEFGTIAMMILAVAIISIIAISAKSRLSIIPRY